VCMYVLIWVVMGIKSSFMMDYVINKLNEAKDEP